MSDFTLTAIERLLDAKLEPITTGMATLATSGEMSILSAKIDEVKATIDSHTASLDTIIKNTSNWKVEMTVMRGRMERYESALKAIGEKLNLDISPFLH